MKNLWQGAGISLRRGTARHHYQDRHQNHGCPAAGKRCLPLSKGREKGLLGLQHLSVGDLCKVNGIGRVKAVKIKCLIELSRRLAMADTRERLQFTKPETVADYYMERLRERKRRK